MVKILKKIKKRDPIVFTGKMLRELSENRDFTLGDFKKRYCLKKINGK